MKQEPQMECEVAITKIYPIARKICFYGTSDAISDFSRFGSLLYGNESEECLIQIDGRYNFSEIVEYMETYG